MAAQTTNSPSYRFVVEKSQCPTRDQAIVVDSINGYPIKDYAFALAKVVNPSDVLGFSRISQGRVCFYLNSKSLVESLIAKSASITVGTSVLPIRPLNARSVRVLISNVQLCIPNSILEDKLKELNIKTVSSVQHVKSGINLPGFTHWMSFRRQVFVHPDSVADIPPILQLHYDGISYNIYLSSSKMACAVCSQEGHIAKYCKEAELNSHEVEPTVSMVIEQSVHPSIVAEPCLTEFPDLGATYNSHSSVPSKTALQPVTLLAPQSEDLLPECLPSSEPPPNLSVNFSALPIKTSKRPLSTSTTSEDCKLKRPSKNHKANSCQENTDGSRISTEDIMVLLQPALDLLSGKEANCLRQDQLIALFQELHGRPHSDILGIASKFTDNLGALGMQLDGIRNQVTHRSFKLRLTKYIKYLSANVVHDLDSSQDEAYP